MSGRTIVSGGLVNASSSVHVLTLSCSSTSQIIVSHHVELLLPIAHSLIRVVDGRLDVAGSVDELRSRGELSSLIAVEEASHSNEETIIPPTPAAGREKTEEEALSLVAPASTDADDDATEESSEEVAPKKEARKMVKDEEREVGNVKWSVYKIYLVATVRPLDSRPRPLLSPFRLSLSNRMMSLSFTGLPHLGDRSHSYVHCPEHGLRRAMVGLSLDVQLQRYISPSRPSVPRCLPRPRKRIRLNPALVLGHDLCSLVA